MTTFCGNRAGGLQEFSALGMEAAGLIIGVVNTTDDDCE